MSVGRAWHVKDSHTGEYIDPERLTNVSPIVVAWCSKYGWRGHQNRVIAMLCPECSGEMTSWIPHAFQSYDQKRESLGYGNRQARAGNLSFACGSNEILDNGAVWQRAGEHECRVTFLIG